MAASSESNSVSMTIIALLSTLYYSFNLAVTKKHHLSLRSRCFLVSSLVSGNNLIVIAALINLDAVVG